MPYFSPNVINSFFAFASIRSGHHQMEYTAQCHKYCNLGFCTNHLGFWLIHPCCVLNDVRCCWGHGTYLLGYTSCFQFFQLLPKTDYNLSSTAPPSTKTISKVSVKYILSIEYLRKSEYTK